MMVYHEKLIEQSENRAVFEFRLDENADYFDGHFPQVKVLPAVAQVDVALHLAEKYLGSGRLVSKMRRLKFSAIIRPDETVCLELIYDKEKQSLTFKMKKPNTDEVYSSGTLYLCGGLSQ
jgi:3-hydroxymyristoyl/3-hydroxydecanoyl-(acyl carrier protein) dehydratase